MNPRLLNQIPQCWNYSLERRARNSNTEVPIIISLTAKILLVDMLCVNIYFIPLHMVLSDDAYFSLLTLTLTAFERLIFFRCRSSFY